MKILMAHPNIIARIEKELPLHQRIENGMSSAVFGQPMYNGMRLFGNPVLEEYRWRIDLLSPSLNISQEVRSKVNATLMKFGKEPLVYIVEQQNF